MLVPPVVVLVDIGIGDVQETISKANIAVEIHTYPCNQGKLEGPSHFTAADLRAGKEVDPGPEVQIGPKARGPVREVKDRLQPDVHSGIRGVQKPEIELEPAR